VAQYRFSAQVIKRSDGRSAVAAAAYRAGQRLVDERLEMPFDYRNRGGVEHTEIMLPEGASAQLGDRSTLWNAVEQAEKRVDARVSREVQLSLPHELDFEQRQALVREFVQTAFVDKGMIADVAMHTPDAEGDQRNYHAHVMLTTRRVDGQGFGQKDRDWDKREQLAEWREQWAETQNRHLVKALGSDAPKVTHKSLEGQGLAREATIHLGPTASAIERKGERSDRGDVNRVVAASNAERQALSKSAVDLDDKLTVLSPQTQTLSMSLTKELAEYGTTMRRQVAAWKAEQVAIRPPAIVKAWEVRREVTSPAKAKLAEAQRELERTKDRVKHAAGKRTTLASFIRNPQRVIWAKIREVHAMDRARLEVARARAGVKVREEWFRSERGQRFVTSRVDAARQAVQPAKAKMRTLERKIRRVEKRIGNVERLRERVQIAEQLGVKSWQRPIKTLSPQGFVRQLDAAAVKALQRATPQQLQQARQQVRSLARGIGISR